VWQAVVVRFILGCRLTCEWFVSTFRKQTSRTTRWKLCQRVKCKGFT